MKGLVIKSFLDKHQNSLRWNLTWQCFDVWMNLGGLGSEWVHDSDEMETAILFAQIVEELQQKIRKQRGPRILQQIECLSNLRIATNIIPILLEDIKPHLERFEEPPKERTSEKQTKRNRELAKLCGARYYYPDKKCRNEHMSPRFTSTGICVQCDRERVSSKKTAIEQDKVL